MADPDHILTETGGRVVKEGTTDEHIILESSASSSHNLDSQYLIFIRRRRR